VNGNSVCAVYALKLLDISGIKRRILEDKMNDLEEQKYTELVCRKVKFALYPAMKTQRGSRCLTLLFL
jgi:hypothetical protein